MSEQAGSVSVANNANTLVESKLAPVDQEIEAALSLASCAEGRIGKVVALAQATKKVLTAVQASWEDIESLKDSPMGFATDEATRKGGPYSNEQLQAAVTHGILLGGMPFNGEITVISGRAYLGLSHYRRLISNCEKVTDFTITFGAIQYEGESRAAVEAIATWKQELVERSIKFTRPAAAGDLDRRVRVRVNAGMGDDAVLGKAERKIRKRCWEAITGQVLEDDDERTVEGTAAEAQAPQAPPEPTQEEMVTAGRGFYARAKAAETLEALDAITTEFRTCRFAAYWSAKGRESFERCVADRRQALEAPAGGLTPLEKFAIELDEAADAKQLAAIWERYFGQSAKFNFTEADRRKANAEYTKRTAALRGAK